MIPVGTHTGYQDVKLYINLNVYTQASPDPVSGSSGFHLHPTDPASYYEKELLVRPKPRKVT